ncbi:hypothetical protein JCM19992_28510 [Thermostilla marina]
MKARFTGKRFELLSFALLLLLCAVLAMWQWHEYRDDTAAARESLERRAETIYHAVSGGLRSHRRLGEFFDEQLGIFLDELVATRDVIRITLFDADGERLLGAGDADVKVPFGEPGVRLTDAGLSYVADIELPSPTPGGPRGPGWGRMARGNASPPFKGGTLRCVMLVDRQPYDQACRRSVRLRSAVAIAGCLVLSVFWGMAFTLARLAVTEQRRQLAEARAAHWRELSQAAAGLAHETRNPLGIVRGWAQRIADESATPEEKTRAETIVEECDRITARINQFLSFTKPCRPKLASIDIRELLEEVRTLASSDLESRNIDCRVEVAEDVERVFADVELLRQAVFNLVHNASRFAPPESRIDVKVSRTPTGGVRVEVADRGPGIPPDDVPKLFTPYFTTRSDGTGLGLAIVRRIAVAHGGSVTYTPRDGGGAVFALELPSPRFPKTETEPLPT